MVIKSKGSEARLLRLRMLVCCVTLATTLTFLCSVSSLSKQGLKKNGDSNSVYIIGYCED